LDVHTPPFLTLFGGCAASLKPILSSANASSGEMTGLPESLY
jgi:hypothetical protein